MLEESFEDVVPLVFWVTRSSTTGSTGCRTPRFIPDEDIVTIKALGVIVLWSFAVCPRTLTPGSYKQVLEVRGEILQFQRDLEEVHS